MRRKKEEEIRMAGIWKAGRERERESRKSRVQMQTQVQRRSEKHCIDQASRAPLKTGAATRKGYINWHAYLPANVLKKE